MIAGHKALNSMLITQYEEEFELLVVEIELKEKQIRIISSYGPPENWLEEKRMPFFIALEAEIEKAALADRSVIIKMDANAKLGAKYIKGDPHDISPNGSILAQTVERQGLIVGNGTDICKGMIKRKRVTKHRTKQIGIDIMLFGGDMLAHLVNIEINENRKYVFTKVVNNKKGTRIQESDHNPIITEFKLQQKETKEDKKLELYNLKKRTLMS